MGSQGLAGGRLPHLHLAAQRTGQDGLPVRAKGHRPDFTAMAPQLMELCARDRNRESSKAGHALSRCREAVAVPPPERDSVVPFVADVPDVASELDGSSPEQPVLVDRDFHVPEGADRGELSRCVCWWHFPLSRFVFSAELAVHRARPDACEGPRKSPSRRNRIAPQVLRVSCVLLRRSGLPTFDYSPISSSGVHMIGIWNLCRLHTDSIFLMIWAFAKCLQFHVRR